MKYFLLILILGSLVSHTTYAKKISFNKWKKSYAKRAARRGLPKKFVLGLLKDVEFDPSVIEKDKKQVILSKKVDYQVFIKRWLREEPSRVQKGRELLKENLVLLKKIEAKYGVDKEAIISLWGVETFYGEITGDYNLIRSLASLSYDGRRRKFFETQLNAAIRLIRDGHVSADELKGSWAGATGQCQFMPSNINVYARDWNGDGKKDIWTTKEDVFASIAYFLKKVGWKKGKSIGSLVIRTKDKKVKKHRKLSLKKYRTPMQYTKLGFTNIDGSKLEKSKWRARMMALIPMQNSPTVLRGSNYKPLLAWNNSSLFAAFNIMMINGLTNTSKKID